MTTLIDPFDLELQDAWARAHPCTLPSKRMWSTGPLLVKTTTCYVYAVGSGQALKYPVEEWEAAASQIAGSDVACPVYSWNPATRELLMQRAVEDLFEVINRARTQDGPVPLRWVCTWAHALLRMCSAVHARALLHGDIKPDNVFVMDAERSIRLGDWGRSVDLSGYKPDQMFSSPRPDVFMLMSNYKSWRYQIDYVGVCGVVYALLHREYLDRLVHVHGRWTVPKRVHPRFVHMFDTLLNHEGCDPIPDLESLVDPWTEDTGQESMHRLQQE